MTKTGRLEELPNGVSIDDKGVYTLIQTLVIVPKTLKEVFGRIPNDHGSAIVKGARSTPNSRIWRLENVPRYSALEHRPCSKVPDIRLVLESRFNRAVVLVDASEHITQIHKNRSWNQREVPKTKILGSISVLPVTVDYCQCPAVAVLSTLDWNPSQIPML